MKVLATSWHPGGTNAITPVVKRLLEEGKVNVAVIGHEFSEPIFSKAGIGFKTLANCGLPDVSFESMKKLLALEEPDLVLTGTSSQEGKGCDIIEQSITLAAKKSGVQSVAVLDTWENYSVRFQDERTSQPFDRLPDFVAIMDEIARQEMLAEGFPEEKLVVTGNPHFDSLAAEAQAFTETQREEARRQIGLAEYPILFFFAGNGFSTARSICGYWDGDVAEAILDTMSNLLNVGLVVRLHPRMEKRDPEGFAKIQQVFSSFSNRIRLDKDPNT